MKKIPRVPSSFPPVAMPTVAESLHATKPFEFRGNSVKSRFIVVFESEVQLGLLMDEIALGGALHIPLHQIKGIVVKERNTVTFANSAFEGRRRQRVEDR